jgi:phosphatidylglycerol lysyltransferase
VSQQTNENIQSNTQSQASTNSLIGPNAQKDTSSLIGPNAQKDTSSLIGPNAQKDTSSPIGSSALAGTSSLAMIANATKSSWPVWLAAGATLLSGLVGTVQPILVRLSEHHPRLFSIVASYELYHLSKTLTVAFGYLLIFLSINLLSRKQRAWQISLCLSSLSVVLQWARIGSEHIHWLQDKGLARDLPTYSFIPALIAVILLICTRSYFQVRSEKETVIKAAKIISLSLCAVMAYGVLGFFLLDVRDFKRNFQLQESAVVTARELTLMGNSDLTAHTKFGTWFIDSLHLYGILAGVVIVVSAFRPINYRLVTQLKERELAREILEKHGRAALDIFKLSLDKSFFFDEAKDSFISYKTCVGVAIVLGDAVGAKDNLRSLVRDFAIYCHNNGWKVAFMQATPAFLDIYHSLGFKSVRVGEDGIVDLALFTSKTVTKKTFKSVVKKFDKEGYVLNRHVPPHSEAILNDVEGVSRQWLTLPGRRERGFSLGKFDRAELQSDNLFVLRDKDGKVLAFVNQIRSYCPSEVTIDMMRHIESAPNGTMDFLFSKLLFFLKDEGFTQFSLGLAALSGVGEDADASLEEKAMKKIFANLNRFFSYKGLKAYKDKFDPTWEDRFLVYEGGVPGLVQAGVAIAKATEE